MLSESAMEVSIISSRHDADWLLDFPLRLGFVVHAAAIVEATNLSFQLGEKSVGEPSAEVTFSSSGRLPPGRRGKGRGVKQSLDSHLE
jgi:hypothetical protein